MTPKIMTGILNKRLAFSVQNHPYGQKPDNFQQKNYVTICKLTDLFTYKLYVTTAS